MKNKLFILGCYCLLAMTIQELSLDLHYPAHFPKPIYNFENNPLSSNAIELGRALFYDPILSKDRSISCASCHSSYNAFAHTDHDLSHGINDEIGQRNAPALFNLAWQKSFMWDGAINHLDMQALAPISSPTEMGEEINHVIAKLQQSSLYPTLFYEAFGDSLITGEHFLKALSQFQLTLISANSKYDKVKTGLDSFSAQEVRGYELFKENCNTCHSEPLFTNTSFANNGLAVDTTLNDYGKWQVTKDSRDSLFFKIPSLRNLTYSYPYMHDGRYKTLKQVLNHYNSNLESKQNLSPGMATIKRLSSNEQTDLIAFLLSLNDKDFIFNPKYNFPKKILNVSKEK